ncbi:hypothetical protein F4809DRAFT_662712 [Biscogniauxia mediterranea]|nr:hypothetical protein F4809DRAFT_662712 [Biscogniauxia mediterranea]
MPHRVVDFFRSSNDSIHNIKASVQRISSPTTHTRSSSSRERTSRTSSYASSIDESAEEQSRTHSSHHHHHHNPISAAPAVKMPEPVKEKHRLSFPGLHLGGPKLHKDQSQNPHASLDWKIESPPAVMHGSTEESTGALVSGQLLLCVKEEVFEVESFDAKLEIHVMQKRPFNHHCQSCQHQRTELKTWSLLREPTTLSKRTHEFPFSVLLAGHLPATTDNSVMSIHYEFTAEVKPKTGPALKLSRTIDVRRSLPVPELPHHSVRIFPPTNITASVHFAQIIHPIGANQFTLRLEGIVKHNVDAKSVEYWKLKRLSWKLEEHLSTVAPACDKHSPRDPDTGLPAKKGTPRSDSRTLAHADLHGGWKADYSPNGNIEAEVEYQCAPSARAACDVKGSDGSTEITHQLVVEMVVVQEYAPLAHPTHITPTGVARILRMHFAVVLTERAGLGVSWDNEAPPIYQDVPPSPPAYSGLISYNAAAADDDDGSVEDLSLGARGSHNDDEEAHQQQQHQGGATEEIIGRRGESPAYEELPPPPPFPAEAEGSSEPRS